MVPDAITAEWVAKEFKENGYKSDMSISTTKGARMAMTEYLKANGVFYSDTDNGEKWRRVVRDLVPNEQKHANPRHYGRVPPKFYGRWDFVTYHYLFPARAIHSPVFRYGMAFVFTYYAHYWSFELYVKPFGMLPPCSKLPIHPQCHFLKIVQDYTFNGWNDFAKVFMLWVVQQCFGKVAEVIAPLRRR